MSEKKNIRKNLNSAEVKTFNFNLRVLRKNLNLKWVGFLFYHPSNKYFKASLVLLIPSGLFTLDFYFGPHGETSSLFPILLKTFSPQIKGSDVTHTGRVWG